MSNQNDPRMAKRDSGSPEWYMKDQQEWPEMAQNDQNGPGGPEQTF